MRMYIVYNISVSIILFLILRSTCGKCLWKLNRKRFRQTPFSSTISGSKTTSIFIRPVNNNNSRHVRETLKCHMSCFRCACVFRCDHELRDDPKRIRSVRIQSGRPARTFGPDTFPKRIERSSWISDGGPGRDVRGRFTRIRVQRRDIHRFRKQRVQPWGQSKKYNKLQSAQERSARTRGMEKRLDLLSGRIAKVPGVGEPNHVLYAHAGFRETNYHSPGSVRKTAGKRYARVIKKKTAR